MRDQKSWDIAWARFQAFRKNLPDYIKEDSVRQYHEILSDLESALGEPLDAFRIPAEKLAPKINSVRPAGYSGRRGHVTFSRDKYCDPNYFESQSDGLYGYLKIALTSSTTMPPTHQGMSVELSLSDNDQVHSSNVRGPMQQPVSKPVASENEIRIFISHSSEDREIAAALTELLKNALSLAPEAIRCTSADGHRLSVGAKTDEQLKRELLNAKSFIALLTEESLNSTWVLFELGARWGADRHLAPVFAAGLTAEQLRGPLPGISGLSCDSDNQVHQLVHDIANVLGVEVRPTHLYSKYVSELMKASASARERRSL